jgi:hypothetical protein
LSSSSFYCLLFPLFVSVLFPYIPINKQSRTLFIRCLSNLQHRSLEIVNILSVRAVSQLKPNSCSMYCTARCNLKKSTFCPTQCIFVHCGGNKKLKKNS